MPPVIFDLDGTLIDSLRDLREAVNVMLTEVGRPALELDTVRRFIGEGARMLVARALELDLSDARVTDGLHRFREAYATRLTGHTRPYDGIPELLAHLAAHQVPTAVLSNKPHDATRQVVAHYFGDHAFVEVLGQRNTVPRKPDPAAALELAERFGTDPAQVAFVGDSDVDMQTARAAGMQAIGVTWGLRSREILLQAGAHELVDHPHALMARLAPST